MIGYQLILFPETLPKNSYLGRFPKHFWFERNGKPTEAAMYIWNEWQKGFTIRQIAPSFQISYAFVHVIVNKVAKFLAKQARWDGNDELAQNIEGWQSKRYVVSRAKKESKCVDKIGECGREIAPTPGRRIHTIE